MRGPAWLLVAVLAFSWAAPGSGATGGSFLKTAKSSEVKASASAEAASSEEESKYNAATGDSSKRAQSSQSKASAESSAKSSETAISYKGGCNALTEEIVQKEYVKKSCEDDDAYFKRICTKTSSETIEQYIQRLSLTHKCFPGLQVWNNQQYLNTIKGYFSTLYAQKSGECDKTYFSRLLAKDSVLDKTDDLYSQRIFFLSHCFPDLSLWRDENNLDIVKDCFATVYAQKPGEPEDIYFKRLVERDNILDTSSPLYAKRIHLISRCYPSLPLWYDKKYIDIVRPYYTALYDRKSCGSDVDYAKKITAQDDCIDKNLEIRWKRVNLLQLLTGNCGIWNSQECLPYLKDYYSAIFSKGSSEGCESWLSRVCQLVPGECEQSALKRIGLIKNIGLCNSCWTSGVLKKLEGTNLVPLSFLTNIKKTVLGGGGILSHVKRTASGLTGGQQNQGATVKCGCS